MSGYNTYLKYQRIEEHARELGFRLANSKYGGYYGGRDQDMVALYPANETALPVFSRDAELFCGTFTEVETFLLGWEKAQQYDALLRMTDTKRREKFEQAELKRQEDARIKREQQAMWKVLKEKTDEVQS